MTEGQALALDQVRDIEAAGDALELLDVQEQREGRPNLVLNVSISCANVQHRPGGLRLRSRERLLIFVPPDFPFEYPVVITPHRRFAGFPHVQWGMQLCLYQAPATEWSTSDGMFGFADRLYRWLEQAALGELDAAGAPLHPPVAYIPAGPQRLVVPRVNTPAMGSETWFGYAHLSTSTDWRVDLTGWSSLDSDGVPPGVGAAVLLSEPMPFEFPTKVDDLIQTLSMRGVSRHMLFLTLQCALLHNQDDAPLYVVLGTPMRGTAGTRDLKQHLTAWYIDPVVVSGLRLALHRYSSNPAIAEIGAEVERIILEWTKAARVAWCNVREDRPEIVTRRDRASRAFWFQGKVVSLWGCGALGGFVAEFLARAGAQKLILHDKSTVGPGILVRQQYDDRDLGRNKAEALAERLLRARPDLQVEVRTSSLLNEPLDSDDWTEGTEVLIDTTASGAVRSKLELRRKRGARRIIIIAMMMGHEAKNGVVTITPANYSGGPNDALRYAKVRACGRPDLSTFIEEFWPHARHPIFQPEPGCSDPTFTGSAADAAALAGIMLNVAAEALRSSDDAHATAAFVNQSALGSPPSFTSFSWPPEIVLDDPATGYEIRIAAGAWADIKGWLSRTRRTSGGRVETGGLIFGERDDAARVIWVTEAIGPPPDSRTSENGFVCGILGTNDANREKSLRTRNSVAYVGMWHSHPEGEPLPSQTDLSAMEHLVSHIEDAPSKLLLLIVGGSEGQRRTSAMLFKKSDFENLRHDLGTSRMYRVLGVRTSQLSASVGLTLSGGGARAMAFHLGCMRALYDRGILSRIRVISAVSGGSIIAAIYAYGKGSFEDFDGRVLDVLKSGINCTIVKNAIRPTNLASWKGRTLAFQSALETLFFGKVRLTDARRDGLDVIFNACELRTGTAFRFGSRESACSRFGKIPENDVSVSFAVAASAAYPVLLPPVDCEMTFEKGAQRKAERVIITDGGVYDNLGLSCLQPGRSEQFSSNVFSPDYLICCDAGPGQFDGSVFPSWWPARMKRSFETTFRRNLEASYAALHSWSSSGAIRGFGLLYLGQQDERLPYIPPDLVRREAVASYPTDFAAMNSMEIERLTARGEQLGRLLISRHLPEL